MHEESFANEDWAEASLEQAADLFVIATGVDADPATPFERRLVQRAILSLAHYLIVTDEDREAAYSPFSSERIGSYSYSKSAQAVMEGNKLGVMWFDQAVQWFSNKIDDVEDPSPWTTSEWVFKPGYEESQKVILPDNYGW